MTAADPAVSRQQVAGVGSPWMPGRRPVPLRCANGGLPRIFVAAAASMVEPKAAIDARVLFIAGGQRHAAKGVCLLGGGPPVASICSKAPTNMAMSIAASPRIRDALSRRRLAFQPAGRSTTSRGSPQPARLRPREPEGERDEGASLGGHRRSISSVPHRPLVPRQAHDEVVAEPVERVVRPAERDAARSRDPPTRETALQRAHARARGRWRLRRRASSARPWP